MRPLPALSPRRRRGATLPMVVLVDRDPLDRARGRLPAHRRRAASVLEPAGADRRDDHGARTRSRSSSAACRRSPHLARSTPSITGLRGGTTYLSLRRLRDSSGSVNDTYVLIARAQSSGSQPLRRLDPDRRAHLGATAHRPARDDDDEGPRGGDEPERRDAHRIARRLRRERRAEGGRDGLSGPGRRTRAADGHVQPPAGARATSRERRTGHRCTSGRRSQAAKAVGIDWPGIVNGTAVTPDYTLTELQRAAEHAELPDRLHHRRLHHQRRRRLRRHPDRHRQPDDELRRRRRSASRAGSSSSDRR